MFVQKYSTKNLIVFTSLTLSGFFGGVVRHEGDPGQHPPQSQGAVHPEGRLPAEPVDEQRGSTQCYDVANLPC